MCRPAHPVYPQRHMTQTITTATRKSVRATIKSKESSTLDLATELISDLYFECPTEGTTLRFRINCAILFYLFCIDLRR